MPSTPGISVERFEVLKRTQDLEAFISASDEVEVEIIL